MDGYHRCERCGYWIEDGDDPDCDVVGCPEFEPKGPPPAVYEEPPLYFGARP